MKKKSKIIAWMCMILMCLTFVGCTDEDEEDLQELMSEIERLSNNVNELKDGVIPEDFIDNVTDTVSSLNDVLEKIEPALNEYQDVMNEALENLTPAPVEGE